MSIPQSQHQQYETIVAIAQRLRVHLLSSVLTEAYTLSLNELVLVFSKANQSWFVVKIVQEYQTCFWWFGNDKPSKPSNAQPCFESVSGQGVDDIVMHENNRSFVFKLKSVQLVFKCYDALVNVLLVEGDEVTDLFRKRIENDWDFDLKPLTEVSLNTSSAVKGYVYKRNHAQYPYYFSLIESADELVFTSDDILDVLETFSRLALSHLKFFHAQQKLLTSRRAELKKLEASLNAAEQSLISKRDTVSNEQIGHLIMANMHLIQPGTTTVELFDFYHNKQVLVKLKKDLNAQQNAAYYYRKHKNSSIEAQQLKQKMEQAQKRITTLKHDCEVIEAAVSMKQLRSYIPKEKSVQVAVPYRQFECEGFLIWVGKSAAANDELTMRHAHKNDLWLHAKDVSGSHVLIKWRPGKEYPVSVIKHAASIAAYYSKLKGSNLVPVSYTPRKFVRKPKGSVPGQVIVEKEEVLLVEPSNAV